MIKPHRHQPLWFAYILHRISGVALALFLPLHFCVLGLAIDSPNTFDNALDWSAMPIVKFAEFGLVFFLALHLFGGLRLMALEFLPWQSRQKTLAAASVAISFLLGLCFLLRAI